MSDAHVGAKLPRAKSPAKLVVRLGCAGVCAVLVSGCAMQIPLASMSAPKEGAEVTGSIAPRDGRFSNAMSDEDWSRAKTAVQAALDEKTDAKDAAAVAWNNPATGMKGTITRVAGAVATPDGECRAFVATMVDGSQTEWFQGQACRSGAAGGASWTVTSAAQWTPPPRQA